MSKSILILLLGMANFCHSTAQNLLEEMWYPDTLKSGQDSFFIDSPQFDAPLICVIKNKDTVNWGTSGYKGVYMKIWTDLDTIIVPHVNYPFRQFIKIPITSPTDTTHFVIRFQAANSDFNKAYIEKNKNNISFEIPETYELANIILYLSNCSEKTFNRPEKTEYIDKVEAHFGKFRQHKLIQILNKKCRPK